MELKVPHAGTCNPQVENCRTRLKRGRKAPGYFHSFSLQQELGEQHADVTARGSFSPSPEPTNLVSRGMHKRHTQTLQTHGLHGVLPYNATWYCHPIVFCFLRPPCVSNDQLYRTLLPSPRSICLFRQKWNSCLHGLRFSQQCWQIFKFSC